MQTRREHIIFRILTLVLVTTLLVPSVIKFSHIFSHHQHKICTGGTSTHIHKVDLDCDFQKFQLNKTFTIHNSYSKLFSLKKLSVKIVSQYDFLSSYQQLYFALRGPPCLI